MNTAYMDLTPQQKPYLTLAVKQMANPYVCTVQQDSDTHGLKSRSCWTRLSLESHNMSCSHSHQASTSTNTLSQGT